MIETTSRLAEAVEEGVKEDAQGGVDQASDAEVPSEPGLWLCEKQSIGQDDYTLMEHEERGSEGEARGRMFGVQACADGRSKIADDGFGNAEQTERGLAEAILQEADGGAEQKPGRRITAAEAEVDCYKQRQIENARFGNVNRQKRLQDYSDQHAEQDGPGAEFMNLDVRFADTEVVGFVHGRLYEGLAAFAAAVGCGGDPAGAFSGAVELLSCGGGSFFRTTGSVVNRTMTSSSFSRLAEGFTRICLY